MWGPRRRPFFRAVATGRASASSRTSDLARKNREKSRRDNLLAKLRHALADRNSPEFRSIAFDARDIIPLLTAALVSTVDPIADRAILWVAVAATAILHTIRTVYWYRSQRSTRDQGMESSGKGNDARHAPRVPSPPKDAVVLTVAEVAQVLRVSKETVHRIISRKELEAIHIGTIIRVRRDVLDKYMGITP
jgi:excisionase family DNA binding protein